MGECKSLKVTDIDFDNNIIHVVGGKGAKSRMIPINAVLKEELQNLLQVRNQNSVYIFSTISGSLSATYINRTLKAAAIKAGLGDNISAHILRHSFASNLLKNGVDIVRVQRLLGHAFIETTAIYLHTNMEGLQNAVDALGGGNSEG